MQTLHGQLLEDFWQMIDELDELIVTRPVKAEDES